MMTRTRPRRFLQKSLAIASAVGFLMAAGAANAHHRDRDHHRSYRTYDHGDRCDSRRSHRHERRHHRRSRHYDHDRYDRYERRAESYQCGPCSKRFHSRSKFHRHLTHHHHVPFFALPFVIVKSTLGWIFHG